MTDRQPIPNINIGQVYDQRYSDAQVHYDKLANLADFFGRNMPVHRHDRFFQVHYVKSGTVRVYLDDQQYVESGPMFFFTPPTVPHSFVTEADSDGDLLEDGLEVANDADPLDPTSWPNLKDGKCGPYGKPDNQLNAGDLVVAIRIALGELPLRALELAHCDLGTPDDDIDVADILLLIQMLQSLPGGI